MRFRVAFYRGLYRMTNAMLLRFTPPGLGVLGLALAAAAAGVDTTLSMSFELFGFSAALALVSWGLSVRRAPVVSVQRLLPEFATVHEPLEYSLTVRNTTPGVLAGLSLRDLPAESLPDPDYFRDSYQSSPVPRWQRIIGHRRFFRLARLRRGGSAATVAVPALASGGTALLRVPFTPVRRGLIQFDRTMALMPEPLGLARSRQALACEGQLTVLPRRYPVRKFTLAGARRFQKGGVSLASHVGESEEFISLREYRPGDPRRAIHWKSWARTGRPVVKEFQDEFFVRYGLILDTFAEGVTDVVFEAAVAVAASLACAERAADSLLDLLVVEDRLYRFTQGRGLGSTGQLLRVLAAVTPCRRLPFARLADAALAQAPALSGGFCVLLGWDKPRADFARAVVTRGLNLDIIVIGDARMADPLAGLEPALARRVKVVRAAHLAGDLRAL